VALLGLPITRELSVTSVGGATGGTMMDGPTGLVVSTNKGSFVQAANIINVDMAINKRVLFIT
jgi:hypothetical protein